MNEKVKDTEIAMGLKSLFTGLANMAQAEEAESYETYKYNQAFVQAASYAKDNNFEAFDYLFLHEIEKPINGLLESICESDDFTFLMLHGHDIEVHFAHFIKQFEGTACNADKSRTIIRSLLKHFRTGDDIKFNYDAEFTYHLPNTIFKTHDDIIEFYKGLRKLIITGNPDAYLLALQVIMAVK